MAAVVDGGFKTWLNSSEREGDSGRGKVSLQTREGLLARNQLLSEEWST
jgi:hypothetical protein